MHNSYDSRRNPEMEKVDSILEHTVHTMEEGRDEVFRISENSRLEIMHREQELLNTQNLIAFVIGEVERLEKEEKASKALLKAVSEEPDKFPEYSIEDVFDQTEKTRLELKEKRELEEDLKAKRTTLEFFLKNAREVLKRTEELTGKMGSALEFLRGTLVDVIQESKVSRSLGLQIIRLQEQERRRVSREIHDGPAQFMANVVMKADYCSKIIERDTERAKGELKSLKKQVRDSMADIRRIIFDLMPMSLEELGLVPTIKQHIENIKGNKKLNIEFEYNENTEFELDHIVRLSVFRIVQESLNNIIKHAEAKNISIKMTISSESLYVSIKDDGIGFSNKNDRAIKKSSGFGILGMKERVRLLNGEFEIISIDEGVEGCELRVTIPLRV